MATFFDTYYCMLVRYQSWAEDLHEWADRAIRDCAAEP
jgi:hypothetical protein